MSRSPGNSSPQTFEFTPVQEIPTGERIAPPKRDLLKSLELRALHFVHDGMDPEAAEQQAVEEFLDRLAKDADGEEKKYNLEAEELRARLEAMRKQTPEAAPWFQKKLLALRGAVQELAVAAQKALDALFERDDVEEKESYHHIEQIEDLCERQLEEWTRRGYLARQVEVSDAGGTREMPQSQRISELITLIRHERERIRILTEDEASPAEYESLRLAELELLEYEAGVGELEAYENLDLFLAQPLTEIHQQLQEGARHPRVTQQLRWTQRTDYAQRRRTKEIDLRLGYRSAWTEDLLVNRLISEKGENLRHILTTLQAGWHPRFPQAVRDRFVIAAHQIENRAFGNAAKTLADVIGELPSTDKAIPGIMEMQRILQEREKNPADETARVSREVYQKILAEEPERAQELQTRQELEDALRTGEILSWRTVKTVKGKNGNDVTEDNVKGNDKVFELTIAREGKPPLRAFAKSAHTEGFLRESIPSGQTTLMEWQAAQEAVILGIDAVPPTVIRTFPFGEMSVQLYATDLDENGVAKEAVNAYATEDWEQKITDQNREEVALFQLLTEAQDAGEPNYVLTALDTEKFYVRSIDNGLSNGAEGKGLLLSCLLAASSERIISEETFMKLKRYERRLNLVERTLKSVVLYDTDPLIKRKRQLAQTFLRTGRFGRYGKDYGGGWQAGDGISLLRDGGRFERKYRVTGPEETDQIAIA